MPGPRQRRTDAGYHTGSGAAAKGDPRKNAALRRDLRMSQSVFAATLNVSIKTVQSWEQGLRAPNQASLRLLQIIRTQPSVVDTFIAERSPSGRTL